MDRRPSHPSVPVDPVDGRPQISYQPPHVLDADYGPQTIHRSDLFFINSSPHMKNPDPRQPNTAAPPISTQLYPYHQQAFHHRFSPPAPPPPSALPVAYPHNPYPQNPPYYEYRQRAASAPARPPPPVPPPPLPPKPIVYPALGALTTTRDEATPYTAPPSRPPPPLQSPIPPNPQPAESPVEESNELAMVLALSQSESVQRQILDEQLRQKEEDDLAKALAESVLSSGGNRQSSNDSYFGRASNEALILEAQYDSPTVMARPNLESLVSNGSSGESKTTPEVSHTTDSGYSDVGGYDKWHAPGSSPITRDGNSLSDQQVEQELAPAAATLSVHDPPIQASEGISSRPLSISSVSSLPYTRPSPKSNAFDYTESGALAYTADAHELSLRPSSPAVTAAAVESASAEPTPQTVLVFDDEAYARQLAAEEEELARQEQSQSEEKRNLGDDFNKPPEGSNLPAYSSLGVQGRSIDKLVPNFSSSQSSSSAGLSSRPIHYPVAGPAKQSGHQAHPGSSLSELSSSVSVLPVVYPSFGHHRETDSDARSEASHHSSSRSNASGPPSHSDSRSTSHQDSQAHSHQNNISSKGATDSPVSLQRRISGQAPHLPSPGVLNANQFLDRELLTGVSIGFTPPPISTRLVPMQDPMPNIISLPYARCPPLHLQAPDWRHLLRLMARLSGTRIEPTVEAMAISKSELKLRTVVQFVKPHPSSSDWRTIVWFTIDHPIPPNTLGASRYLSGNPNLLPWSYTLSPVPMLLRDAHDTHLSKTYTIPASEAVPLPTLPITFPNLASYLQAALDYSRQHSSDGSTGVGKLGKVVQMCYLNAPQSRSDFDIPERSTVGHLFKRVIGRSSKDKKKGKGTNNEETYQLVTPFVPDEWG